MPAASQEDRAFDAAAAIVTCLLAGSTDEARRIIYSSDTLYPEMIHVLAGALAAGHSTESWQAAVLNAYTQTD